MPARVSVTCDRNVAVPMRDGVMLYADLYLPASAGVFPVILQRTPYGKDGLAAFALRAASFGYAVLLQDTRGRWQSEGDFTTFTTEQPDGFDTCAWIVAQPWSNGRIGMIGGSYVGATQWQAALSRAPGLQTIVPFVTAADYHEGWCYQGGALELAFVTMWALGLGLNTADRRLASDPSFKPKRDEWIRRLNATGQEFARLPLAGDALTAEIAPYVEEWLAHPADDAYWDQIKVAGRYEQLDLPTLNVGGWFDIFLGGTIANYIGMSQHAKTEAARNATRLVIGPWSHTSAGTGTTIGTYHPGFDGTLPAVDLDGQYLRWYDRHLRDIDNGLDDEPPVSIFVMGANVWRSEREWPLARTRYVDYFLTSGGRANTLRGDGALSVDQHGTELQRPDEFLYDPTDPVPTKGGALCCDYYWNPGGQFDQTEIEQRSDVLCYTSAPLAEPLEVTGPIKVVLYAASSALDTDFTAKLVDVCPCGCAKNLTDGIIRARYRRSTRVESLLTPGSVEEYEIDLWATSSVFLAGHSIRVEISSSNFPRFDRNPNTGGVIATTTAAELVTARQTIHHDAAHPSRIILPIIDASGAF